MRPEAGVDISSVPEMSAGVRDYLNTGAEPRGCAFGPLESTYRLRLVIDSTILTIRVTSCTEAHAAEVDVGAPSSRECKNICSDICGT